MTTKEKPDKGGRIFLAAGIGLFVGVLLIALHNPGGTGGKTSVVRDDTGVAQLGPKAVTLATGLRYEDISEGTGASPKAGDTVVVHYRGRLSNGTEFDASRPRGQPFKFQFKSGQVIQGWDQGIEGMKVGG